MVVISQRHTALLILLLPVALVGFLPGLTWWQMIQEQLDRALIAAVKRNDIAKVATLLRPV